MSIWSSVKWPGSEMGGITVSSGAHSLVEGKGESLGSIPAIRQVKAETANEGALAGRR